MISRVAEANFLFSCTVKTNAQVSIGFSSHRKKSKIIELGYLPRWQVVSFEAIDRKIDSVRNDISL